MPIAGTKAGTRIVHGVDGDEIHRLVIDEQSSYDYGRDRPDPRSVSDGEGGINRSSRLRPPVCVRMCPLFRGTLETL